MTASSEAKVDATDLGCMGARVTLSSFSVPDWKHQMSKYLDVTNN